MKANSMPRINASKYIICLALLSLSLASAQGSYAQTQTENSNQEDGSGFVLACIGTYGYVAQRASDENASAARAARLKLIDFYSDLGKVAPEPALNAADIADAKTKELIDDGRAKLDVLLAACNKTFRYSISPQ